MEGQGGVMPPGREDRMPRLYFSKQKMLYACWHDNSYLVLIAPGLHEHEIESHIFYSENAVKKYLEENGYKKL